MPLSGHRIGTAASAVSAGSCWEPRAELLSSCLSHLAVGKKVSMKEQMAAAAVAPVSPGRF